MRWARRGSGEQHGVGYNNEYSYDSFGNILSGTEGAVTNPFQYIGRKGYYADSDGAYYVRARIDNPVTGRFFVKRPDQLRFWRDQSLPLCKGLSR